LKLFNPRTYISLGLASIVSTALLAASFLGLIPDRHEAVRAGRLALAETVAASSAAFLGSNDPGRLEDLLRFVEKRNPDLHSIGLRTREGRLALAIGEHARNWGPDRRRPCRRLPGAGDAVCRGPALGPAGAALRAAHPAGPGGHPADPAGDPARLRRRAVRACLLPCTSVGCCAHLGPSQAIPSRVRSALDSLTEGLLVIDQKQNIVLANESLTRLLGRPTEPADGAAVAEIAWLTEAGQPLCPAQRRGAWRWNPAPCSASSS
jgi:PAS domain-containing protein